MRTFFRRLSKVVIVLFCLYHMTAIASYSFPANLNDGIRRWLMTSGRSTAILEKVNDLRWKAFSSYVLMTSQWQIWNLFSPDPMRNVLTMNVEVWSKEKKRWETAVIVDPQNLSGWRSARDAKILYGITNNWEENKPIREKLLLMYCKQLHLPERALVRLLFFGYTIPAYNISNSAFWKKYRPKVESYPDISLRCPKPE